MDIPDIKDFISTTWDVEIVPELAEYIRIPAKSPHFDPDWQANGHIDDAVSHMVRWAEGKLASLPGATLEVVRLPGRTPTILIEVPGEGDDAVLLYGHLDKQPEMTGWSEGLGPWTPVLREGRLYGRGGADDGYALYASLTALLALERQGVRRARAVVLIEACEESGSFDLPHYVEHLAERIGRPSLVICLDSGCGDYERLWLTTSLRGLAGGVLSVQVLNEGVHSGDASGIVPDSFRLARALVERLEDEATGELRLPELHVQIPPARRRQAEAAAAVLGDVVWRKFPFAGSTRPVVADGGELVLSRTWRPQLAVVGASGLPEPEAAGNVLRPATSLKLSIRLPPTADPDRAQDALSRALTSNPPQGAEVRWEAQQASPGWHAPDLAPWLEAAVDEASHEAFGAAAAWMGEGGTIPFMGMLGARFPEAQFLITGVLGPHSNAHGPNEFLDIPTGKRVTVCAALILAAHGSRRQSAATQG